MRVSWLKHPVIKIKDTRKGKGPQTILSDSAIELLVLSRYILLISYSSSSSFF